VAIRRSRCEGIARGNLKSSFALLRTRLRFTRNDNALNRDLGDLFPLTERMIKGNVELIFPLKSHSFIGKTCGAQRNHSLSNGVC